MSAEGITLCDILTALPIKTEFHISESNPSTRHMLLQQLHCLVSKALDELSTEGDTAAFEMFPKAILPWFGWRQEHQHQESPLRCRASGIHLSVQCTGIHLPPKPLVLVPITALLSPARGTVGSIKAHAQQAELPGKG